MWPFETYIIPKRHVQTIAQLTDDEQVDLSENMSELLIKYDNLFKCSFPYSGGLYNAPVNTENIEGCHFHVIFMPPLLRSSSIKKHMVGYEQMANAQRDITPEQAAQAIKSQSNKH